MPIHDRKYGGKQDPVKHVDDGSRREHTFNSGWYIGWISIINQDKTSYTSYV